MKATMNLPSHAFEGLLIAAKWPIILPKGGHGRGSTRLFLISPSTHSYQTDNRFVGGHYRVAARPRSLHHRGVVGVMTR